MKGVTYISRLAGIGLAAAVICGLVFCPPFAWWQALHVQDASIDTASEISRARQVLKQLDNPFVQITDPGNVAIQRRLLLPMIGHYLHLPLWLFLAIPHIGCVVLLAYMAHLVRRERGGWLWALFAAVLLGTGSWFFVSTGWLTYADSWSMLGMLVVACSPSRVILAVACVLEPFIDERFVLGLPLVFVLRQVFFGRFLDKTDRQSVRQCLRDAGWIVACTAPYLVLWLIDLRSGGATSGSYLQMRWRELEHLPPPVYRLFFGTWMGLRCGWVLVVALVALVLVRGRGMGTVISALVVTLMIVLTMGITLVIAADTGRSASMLWPAAVVGLLLMIRMRPIWVRYALPALVAANLLLPASNVIMFFSWPVRNVYAEWSTYRDPSTIFHAANWLNGGKILLGQGKLAEARHQFDVALQLDDHLIEGYVYRAIVNLQLGQITAAAEDADKAMALDSRSADAMFVRGTVDQRQHDAADARWLFERAMKISPADWNFRDDCIAALRATKQ
jgi:hypothetical protein